MIIENPVLENVLGHLSPVVANVQAEFISTEGDLGFNAGSTWVAK